MTAHSLEYLSFLLDGEGYAISIATESGTSDGVIELMKPLPITPVPGVRAQVLGLMSVRGRLVTVFSLRACLGLGPRRLDARSRVLLVQTPREQVGFLVDEVLGVFSVADDELEPASALGGDPGPHVRGIARPEGELVVLLDITYLLDESRPLELEAREEP